LELLAWRQIKVDRPSFNQCLVLLEKNVSRKTSKILPKILNEAEAASAFTQLLKKAWEHRTRQEIRETSLCLSQLRELCSIFSILDGEAQISLLECALLRAEGAHDASIAALQNAESKFSPTGRLQSYDLNFQKALTFHVQSESALALEQFTLAREKAKTIEQRLNADFNRLICFEALGELSLRELDQFEKQIAGPVFENASLIQQLHAMRMRVLFLSGDLKGALRSAKGSGGTQEAMLREFILALPYHDQSHDPKDVAKVRRNYLRDLVAKEPYFFKGGYRYRTLTGEIVSEDLKNFRVSEFADRLYLWTWATLTGSEKLPILELLSHFDFNARYREQSVEDYQMIRNALMWLSLFDERNVSFVLSNFEKFAPRSFSEAPLFQAERNLIEWIQAKINNDEAKASRLREVLLRHRLLATNVSLRWRSLMESVELGASLLNEAPKVDVGTLDLLATRIRERIVRAQREHLIVEVNPNLSFIQIIRREGNQFVRSESLAKALLAFQEVPHLRCEDFVRTCFSFRRYDEFAHKPKIFNLLSRLRGIFPPSVKFGIKDGVVFAEGLNEGKWGELRFATSGLGDDLRWVEFIRSVKLQAVPSPDTGRAEASMEQLKKVLKNRSHLRRVDVQKTLHVSRATAHRLIQRWISSGALKSEGKSARVAIYKLRNKDQMGGTLNESIT